MNRTTVADQMGPSVTTAADGSFVVAWGSPHAPANLGVLVQRFDPTGAALGSAPCAGCASP